MEHLNNIVNNIINNFDFAYMLVINVFTYILIKLVDDFNKEKKVPKYLKRVIFIVVVIAVTSVYILIGYDNRITLLNSAILAPVFWNWILKPIFNKLGIDYAKYVNTD